ncbi:MAG: alpha/beta family hydrolase [Vulcanococcus sp.]
MQPASDHVQFERRIDGASNAKATLVLAHGAGAPMESPFMNQIADGLAQRHWRVVRFNFPYMVRSVQSGKKAAPDRLPTLISAFEAEVRAAAADGMPLWIGGKSMGGRIASLILDQVATEAGVQGGICLGYPFHPPGQPDKLRTEHLQTLKTPCLILQGERDSFGKRGEVEGYGLAKSIQVSWVSAGDHSFKPTKSSGLSWEDNLSFVLEQIDQFAGS